MTERLGVAINPQILALLVRVGARITGNHGFAVRLVEDGLPEGYVLEDCDYNRNLGQFWLVFGPKDDPRPGPIRWLTPVYEREGNDGTDPQGPGM